MAWTFVLVAGTDTLNLNDGTIYSVNVDGFHAPPPPPLTSYAGANLFRHGADLVERSYGNREVTMALTIQGTNASTLGKAVQDIWDYLRRAEEYSKDGIGTQVQLRYQWEGATGTYLFDILEGSLDLGGGLHGPYLLKGTRARNAQLSFVAKPFVTQATETLENYLKDPSAEIAATPLADWTVDSTGGGTFLRSTAQAYRGTASIEMRHTGGAGIIRIFQTINVGTTFASGDTIRAVAWVRSNVATLTGTFRIRQNNAGGTNLTDESFSFTASATGTFRQFTTATTATGTVGTLDIRISVPGGVSGTMYWDNLAIFKGALPVAWISGRDVANHFDDDGQAHINYLDVYDIPGDVPAPPRIETLEKESHSNIWIGARLGSARAGATGVWIEGEDFTSTIGPAWGATSDASFSNGSAGTGSTTATSAGVPDVLMYNIATPPQGQFRVLARVKRDSGTVTFFIGQGYQYGGLTTDPSATGDYKGTLNVTTTRWFDLGVVTIPPTRTPEGGTVGTFGLRIARYINTLTAGATALQIDAVHLVPVDQGGGFGSKDSATDNLWIDSRSNPEGFYRVTTAGVVQSFLVGQVGKPPLLDPKGNRIYFITGSGTLAAESTISNGWTAKVVYQPRYLHVGT